MPKPRPGRIDPFIVLLGCRPWPPGPLPGAGRLCPVCKRGVRPGDETTVCLWCHSASPRTSGRLRLAKIQTDRAVRHNEAERKLRDKLKSKPVVTLSERERRGYWYGGSRKLTRSNPELASTTATCRAWLRSIGQEPNWDLTHDQFGPLPPKREAPEC